MLYINQEEEKKSIRDFFGQKYRLNYSDEVLGSTPGCSLRDNIKVTKY